LAFGFQPFERATYDDGHYQMLQTFEFEEYWAFIEQYSKNKGFSIELKDLISKMLNHDPSQRLSLSQIRNHSWLQQSPLQKDEIYVFLNCT